MPSICNVQNCKNKTIKIIKDKGVSLFRVPINSPELLEKWQNALGMKFKTHNGVCEEHFKISDIKRSLIIRDGNGKFIQEVSKQSSIYHALLNFKNITYYFTPIIHQLPKSLL